MLRSAGVWLGLIDEDEYGDLPRYDDAPVSSGRSGGLRSVDPAMGTPSVRTLPADDLPSGITPVSRPVIRPMNAAATAKVHVVEPTGFTDAQEIGDRLRANDPVNVTLQAEEPELARRLVDFCSGSTYVLGGKMERVARNVFLLTPSNVEVSAEERRRLQERGIYHS
jgi:cell division inhibitor SepF